MTIHKKDSLLHWNYFLALENDLNVCSRYIEFEEANFDTYSIEFAHLLLASSSEVDVIAKELCKKIDSSCRVRTINGYYPIVVARFPEFIQQTVYIDKFGLDFQPWINWSTATPPFWWQSYNKVKHQRKEYFSRANLKNALNSLGALLITIVYYYSLEFGSDLAEEEGFLNTMLSLKPRSYLLRLNSDYYLDSQLD